MTTDESVSCVFPDLNKNVTVRKDSQPDEYAQCIEAFSNQNWEQLQRIMVPEYKVEVETSGDVRLDGDDVYYKGIPIKESALTNAIRRAIVNKLPFNNFVKFMERLYNIDTSLNIKQNLFDWLENNQQAMFDEEGYVIAYKVVDESLVTFHPNPDGSRNTNEVGAINSMPREEVDDNPNHTCSTGLHFCSYTYIPFYGYRGRVVIVRIDPKDIVAIPRDYKFAKGRCCKYEVIGEVDNYFKQPVKTVEKVKEVTEKSVAKVVPTDIETPETVIEEAEEVVVTASDDEVKTVKGILERRTKDGGEVTARNAAKSTKPYVKAIRFVEIARQLGYNIVDKVPVSETIITSSK